MPERFANQAVTTLAETLSEGATTVKVASAAKFPNAGDFHIVVGTEIMLVTAVAGVDFTVARGQEGSTAAAHLKGAEVACVLTVAALEAFIAQAASASVASEKARAEAAEALKLAKAGNLADLASISAARSNLGLGTAATKDVGGAAEVGKVLKADDALIVGLTAALEGKEPADSDLIAIAALTTTGFGRSLLTQVDAAATRATIGTVIGSDVQAHDSDLDAISALTTTSFGRAFLTFVDAPAGRTALGLGTAATKDAGNAGEANKVLKADDPAIGGAGEVNVEKARAEAAEALKLAKAANLADVASASAARGNLGLGTAAVKDAGAAGEVGKVLNADDPGIVQTGTLFINVKKYGAKGDGKDTALARQTERNNIANAVGAATRSETMAPVTFPASGEAISILVSEPITAFSAPGVFRLEGANIAYTGKTGGNTFTGCTLETPSTTDVTYPAGSKVTIGGTAVLYFPDGVYNLDFTEHCLLKGNHVFPIEANGGVLHVDDVSGMSAKGGSIDISDPGGVKTESTVVQATETLNYTGVDLATNTLTGCTGGKAGQSRGEGFLVSRTGVDTSHVLFTMNAEDVSIKLAPGAHIRFDRSVAYEQAKSGSGFGPILFDFPGKTVPWVDPATEISYQEQPVFSDVFRGDSTTDVGPQVQPNTDLKGTGNFFQDDDWALLGSRSYSGFERNNWIGEQVHIGRAGSTMIEGDLTKGATTVKLFLPLNNRAFFDPGGISTTIVADNGSTAVTVASVANLPQSGCLLVNETEQIYYRGYSAAGVLKGVVRGLRGSVTPGGGHAAGKSVKTYGTVLITDGKDTEQIIFTDLVAGGAECTGCIRAANGTTAKEWLSSSAAYEIANPGVVHWRVPVQEVIPYRAFGRRATAKTVAKVDAAVTEIPCDALGRFHHIGIVKLGTEEISYSRRDRGVLYGCVRGVNGTVAAEHASGTTVEEQPTIAKLTDEIPDAVSTANVKVDGAAGGPLTGFRASGENYFMIDDEIFISKGGFTVEESGLTEALSAGATEIPVTDATKFSITGGKVMIDHEHITYAGIAGNTLTGCKRGVDGTMALEHTSGTKVKLNRQIGIIAKGRGARKTTAAAHAVGATVTQVDSAFLQKIDHLRNIRVEGTGMIEGLKTTIPRNLTTSALGFGSGGLHWAFRATYCKNFKVDGGPMIYHCEREGYQFVSCLDVKVDNTWVEGCNRQGFGDSTNFINACQNCVVVNSFFRDVRHGGITSSASNGLHGVPRRIHFVNNVVEDCINACFETQNSGDDVTIALNHFISPGATALELSCATQHVFGNTIKNCVGEAIQLANLTYRPVDTHIGGTNFNDIDTNGVRIFAEDGVTGYGMMLIDDISVTEMAGGRTRNHGLSIDGTAEFGGYFTNISVDGVLITGGVTGGTGTIYSRIFLKRCQGIKVRGQAWDVIPTQSGLIMEEVIESDIALDVRYRTLSSQTGIIVGPGCHDNNLGRSSVKAALLGISFDNAAHDNKALGFRAVGCTTDASMGAGANNFIFISIADIDPSVWPKVHLIVKKAELPAASAANKGFFALVTDEEEGTLRISSGTEWLLAGLAKGKEGAKGGTGEAGTGANALAAPYRTLLKTAARSSAGASGNKYICVPATTDTITLGVGTGTIFLYRLLAERLKVEGKTSKLAVTAVVQTVTAVGKNITFGLYPLVAGATVSLGEVVAGSTFEIASASLTANSLVSGQGADFALPADGNYAVGYTLSGSPATAFVIQAELQIHYV